jgi:hypothetical protein
LLNIPFFSFLAGMHEFAHNMRLSHSGLNGNEYGDRSGVMGYSYLENEGPLMCFNAAKSWELGWYSDKSISFSPSPAEKVWAGKIGGIVDYQTSGNTVVMEIQREANHNNYYIGFNAAKGFNSGTQHGQNQVLLFEHDNGLSWRIADLSAGESYTINKFDGYRNDKLTITVISIDLAKSVADISIVLSTKRNTDPPIEAPTESPSHTPTESPSHTPTESPSHTPTESPSHTPTEMPTESPSLSPTENRMFPRLPPPVVSCQGNRESCVSGNDCCPGYTCGMQIFGGEIEWICRSVPKQSKSNLKLAGNNRLSNLGLGGSRRLLRGESSRNNQDILTEEQEYSSYNGH